jgi:acyl-[acyl carrier protein]--UDP-N-acetylglucosamine O-acyltransferase
LRRAGFPEATVQAVKEAHKLLYRSDRTMRDALSRLKVDFADVPEVCQLVRFLEASESGRQGRQGERPRGRTP